jgi:hypothetical protein
MNSPDKDIQRLRDKADKLNLPMNVKAATDTELEKLQRIESCGGGIFCGDELCGATAQYLHGASIRQIPLT